MLKVSDAEWPNNPTQLTLFLHQHRKSISHVIRVAYAPVMELNACNVLDLTASGSFKEVDQEHLEAICAALGRQFAPAR